MNARPFLPRDAAGVTALHRRVFPTACWDSPDAFEAYVREVLFGNPWVDPEIPSWVIEDDGRVVGFLGIVPRRMRFGSRVLRVAVSCQLMVDPDSRGSFAALTLVRRLFAGPQDLTIADGANDSSRAVWEACGGITSPLHSLHWVRLLRPAQGLLSLAGGRLRGVRAVAAPLAAAVDACLELGRRATARAAARFGALDKDKDGYISREEARDAAWADRFPEADQDNDGRLSRSEFTVLAEEVLALRDEPLTATGLLEAFKAVRAGQLQPDYDLASLEWLLAQALAKRRHGELQGALAREADSGRIAGWFLYYLNGAVSQVLQIGARPGALNAVFEQMADHARSRGARALEGRMEPSLSAVLQGKRCLMQNRAICTLLHARDHSLLVPILRGDAFFSRLEGEWWLRFNGEPPAVVSSSSTSFTTVQPRLNLPHVGA